MPFPKLFSLLTVASAATTITLALHVDKPCCHTYPHAGAAFGPRLPWSAPGVVGLLEKVKLDNGICVGLSGQEGGSVAFVRRGDAPFADAVKACQAAGAIAVVVMDTPASGDGDNSLVVMGPRDVQGISIPSVFVSTRSGIRLEELLVKEAGTVIVSLYGADDVSETLAQIPPVLGSLFMGSLLLMVVMVCCRRDRPHRSSCCRKCCNRDGMSSSSSSRRVTDTSLLEPLRSSGSIFSSINAHNTSSSGATATTPAGETKPPREGDVINPIVLPVVGDDEHTSRVLILPRDPLTKDEPFSVGAQQDL